MIFSNCFFKISFSACSVICVFAPQANNLPINVLLFAVRCARPTSTNPCSSLKMIDTLGKLVEGGSIFSSPLVLAFWGACLLLGSCFLPALIWHGRTGRSNGTECRSDEPFEGNNDGKLIKRADCSSSLLFIAAPRLHLSQCRLARIEIVLPLLWWRRGAWRVIAVLVHGWLVACVFLLCMFDSSWVSRPSCWLVLDTRTYYTAACSWAWCTATPVSCALLQLVCCCHSSTAAVLLGSYVLDV